MNAYFIDVNGMHSLESDIISIFQEAPDPVLIQLRKSRYIDTVRIFQLELRSYVRAVVRVCV